MFCSTCGSEVKETDKVCLACGQPNENYVAPEVEEEVAVEEAAEVAVEEEAVEAAPVAEKKSIVKPIVGLALSALALFGSASGLVSLIMAIVAKVLVKPYKEVTEKPVSIFVKITNILSIITIIFSVIAMIVWVIGAIATAFTVIAGGAAVGGLAMVEFDLFEILEELFYELGLI